MNTIESKPSDKLVVSSSSAKAEEKTTAKPKTIENVVVEADTEIKSDKTAKDIKSTSDKNIKENKDAKVADEKSEKDAKVKDEEPVPIEPTSIFIDHGAILPEFVPGTCLYALVRDPGTLFVYWNATFESNNGWILTAYDAANNVLQSFHTPTRRNGRGYFRIPTAQVARVTLSIVDGGGASEVKLESKIRIAQQLGIAQPKPSVDERWVDIEKHEVIYEAPAPGRAPESHEVYDRMKDPALTSRDGKHDQDDDLAAGVCSLSSRFGKLSGPGSSDLLVSSGCWVRR